MKKRYLALAGLIVMALAAAGCGKDKEQEETPQSVQVTPTPEPTVTEAVDLVDMEVTEDKNVIGTKTASAVRVVIVNRTGSDIGAMYIRVHPGFDDEDEDWGDDLIDGAFTLKNGDEATYYFEPDSDSDATYDIRITYTEEDRNECFFRDLPLDEMSQIALRMEGRGDNSVPYATYRTTSGTGEVSTLDDVLDRLGMSEDDLDDSDGDTDTDDDDDQDEATPTPEPEETPEPDPTSPPSEEPSGDGNGGGTSFDPDDPTPTDDTITAAEGYIGSSFDDLASSLGEPMSNEYEDVPETGTTGYHYYPNFTVTTTVDQYGNETVSGIY